MATYHQSPIQDSGGNTNFIPSTSNNTDKSLISLYWTDVNLKPSFCNVATSGDYNDLTSKPWLFNGSSKIYNYPLNSYIGIGTNNPNYNLDVYGDINFTGSLNQNGTEFKTSQWTTVSSNIYYNLGNVGIGKSTGINEKLDINGNLRIAGNIIPSVSSNYDLGSSNYKWKDLYLSGSSIYLDNFIISKNENSQINLKDTNNNFIGIKANEVSINSNNNSLKIQVNSNGFLNFNINNIDNYPVVFNNPYVYSNIVLSNVLSNTSNSLNTQINSLNIDTLPSGSVNRFIVNDTYNRNITFSGTLTSSNIITSNLSVIGDTTILNTTFYQTEQLQVVNDTTATSMIVKQMNVNNNLAEFYNNTTLNFLINSSGNVGIGYPIINNNYKVDINGGLNLSGASGEVFIKGTNISNIIDLKITNTSNTIVNYNNLINRPSLATVATSGNFSDLTGTPFIISGNNAYSSFTGNLGIGTSVINNKLEVLGSINVGGASGEVLIKNTNISNIIDLKISTTSNTLVNYNNLINRPSLATVATTGNYNDLIGTPQATGGVSDFNLLMNSPFITNGTNIYTNSNVGIGKTNSSYALDVIGDININGSLRISNVPLPISTYSNTNITASNGYFSYINNNNSFGYYTFLTSGSITFPQATNCDLLVVGAGGNGGMSSNGGGGGAGEVIYYPNYPFSQGTSNIRVGYSDFNINNRISRILFNSSSIITALGGGDGGGFILGTPSYSTSETGTVSALTSISGSLETYLSFTSGTINLTLNNNYICDILVVGGGGSGGNILGGGGGAGGVVYQQNVSLSAGTYTITVGNGGASTGTAGTQSGVQGNNGGHSFIQFSGTDLTKNGITFRGYGGGGGGVYFTPTSSYVATAGNDGGSGGGGGVSNSFSDGTANHAGFGAAAGKKTQGLTFYNTTTNTNVQGGYDAGIGYFVPGSIGFMCPGGGGAGGLGGSAPTNGTGISQGCSGGIGVSCSITGVPVLYAGGGGGCLYSGGTITGGQGQAGGGNGATNTSGATSATANTGSGGGGGGWANNHTVSGAGASGIVIIRFRPNVITVSLSGGSGGGGYLNNSSAAAGTKWNATYSYSTAGATGTASVGGNGGSAINGGFTESITGTSLVVGVGGSGASSNSIPVLKNTYGSGGDGNGGLGTQGIVIIKVPLNISKTKFDGYINYSNIDNRPYINNLLISRNFIDIGFYNQINFPLGDVAFANEWFLYMGNSPTNVSNSFIFWHLNSNLSINSKWWFNGTTANTNNEISDIRVKKEIIDIINPLSNLMLIKPKEYYLCDEKDYLKKYGIIAQDVKEVLPEFVYTDTDYIANIYTYCSYLEVNNTYFLNINNNSNITFNNNNIQIGDELKILLNNSSDNNYNYIQEIIIEDLPYHNRYKKRFAVVKEIIDEKTIEITQKLELEETEKLNLFIYGKKVNNFLKLDYSSLYTLNINSTQELYKKINEQKLLIDNLEERLLILENKK